MAIANLRADHFEPTAPRTEASISANDDVRSFRELALLQAFTNGLVKNVRNLARGWGEDDHTEAVIFCSFFLAATSAGASKPQCTPMSITTRGRTCICTAAT